MAKPRIKLPKTATPGEVITIKTLVSHTMESGQRKDKQGETIPRMIINRFDCTFNGVSAFSCDLEPAISANPYLEFTVKVDETGEFDFTWVDDSGAVFNAKQTITVA